MPNFFPPAYDFTTEEDEEEEEEYNKGSFFLNLLYSAVLGLAFYRLMNSEVIIEFKFSVSKSKNKL